MEQLIGGYLSRRKREEWVVATKFGQHFQGHLLRKQLWRAEDVLKQLDDSLRALGTEYIDLYQFHSGTVNEFNNDKLWSMLDRQKQAGKIRHLGVSISASNNGIYQASAAADVDAEVIQVVYNRLDRKPDAVFGQGDVRANHNEGIRQQQLRAVAEIAANEVPSDLNMAQWALAWCLQHPAVTSVIPGCKNVEQVISNASAADLDMVVTK